MLLMDHIGFLSVLNFHSFKKKKKLIGRTMAKTNVVYQVKQESAVLKIYTNWNKTTWWRWE